MESLQLGAPVSDQDYDSPHEVECHQPECEAARHGHHGGQDARQTARLIAAVGSENRHQKGSTEVASEACSKECGMPPPQQMSDPLCPYADRIKRKRGRDQHNCGDQHERAQQSIGCGIAEFTVSALATREAVGDSGRSRTPATQSPEAAQG